MGQKENAWVRLLEVLLCTCSNCCTSKNSLWLLCFSQKLQDLDEVVSRARKRWFAWEKLFLSRGTSNLNDRFTMNRPFSAMVVVRLKCSSHTISSFDSWRSGALTSSSSGKFSRSKHTECRNWTIVAATLLKAWPETTQPKIVWRGYSPLPCFTFRSSTSWLLHKHLIQDERFTDFEVYERSSIIR